MSLPQQREWDHLLATFDVTLATDANSGGGGNVGDLRWAITQANAAGGADTITFSIGTGVATINLAAALPNVTGQVTIDGTTQEGFAGTPLIEIVRNAAPAAANGLVLAAGSAGSTIRGLSIQSFGANGILVQSASNVIAGNYIGLDADGTTARGNNTVATGSLGGIRVESANNTIGGTSGADRNVLADNRGGGNAAQIVLFGNAATGNRIVGNYIGTNAAGTATGFLTGSKGILVDGGDGNTIGGATAAERNVIAGNRDDGIALANYISGNAANSNLVLGNWIGQDALGAALGNSDDGIEIIAGSSNNQIGGAYVGAGNVIRASGDEAIELLGDGSDQNRISGNSIYGNSNLGINLNKALGVDANDLGDADANANQAQNYPVITTVTRTASTLRLVGGFFNDATNSQTLANTTFWIEFFATGPADPNEGRTYLGGVSVTTDGTGVATFDVTFNAVVAGTDLITATATDPLGNTSEFSTGVAVPAVTGAGNTISGTIYEDVNGDASLADAVGAAGVTIRLYQNNGGVAGPDGADTLVATSITNSAGQYTFTNLADAVYWVVVDSRTITPNASLNGPSFSDDVWAEQTYASANNTASANHGAVRAVYYDGAAFQYDQTAGAFYGGLIATRSDNGTTLGAVGAVGAEHLQRVRVLGGSVANVNSAFSFNVVTNIRGGDATDDAAGQDRTVQGSLRQFIQNANGASGGQRDALRARRLRQSEWHAERRRHHVLATITVTNALPQITDAGTTIDGTAFAATDGTTVRDTNAGLLGAGGTVGVDGLALAQVERPELEIRDGGGVADGLDINAANATIRDLAISGFNANGIHVRAVNGTTITGNIIGSGPAAFADPGAAARNTENIYLEGSDSSSIAGNLIGFAAGHGVWLVNSADGNAISGNEIRRNGLVTDAYDGIDISSGSNNTLSGNFVTDNVGPGIDVAGFGGPTNNNTVVNNTITANVNGGASEIFAVRIGNAGGGNTGTVVDRNVITSNSGVGVLVEGSVSAARITRNSIQGNALLGIDLAGGAGETAAGVTPNDAGDGDAGPNALQNFPVLTSASMTATSITVNGTLNSTANRNYRVEFFASPTADASVNGEGQTYLGYVDVPIGGSGTANFSWTQAVTVTPGWVITATATRADATFTSFFETSEFSEGVAVATAPIGTITVDGAIDAAWAAVAAKPVAFDTIGAGTTAADLSATWKALWDANYLYVLVDITDDILRNDGPGLNPIWANDIVEIFIDSNNSRGAAYDGINDYQFGFEWGDPPNSPWQGSSSLPPPAGLLSSQQNTANGWRLEVAVPWAQIGVPAPAVGDTIGFHVAVGDDDSIGVTAPDGRIGWAPEPDTSWVDPSTFGEVTLTGAPISISGTVYHDVVGDGSVAADTGVAGVTVRLYQDDGDNTPDAGDGAAILTTTTNASGVYTFTNLADGTYFVVVDSRTINAPAYNGPGVDDDVWADQTYAVANNTALGSAGAVRAVYYSGGYLLDSSTGAFFGGLSGSRSDDGVTFSTPGAGADPTPGAEHIQLVSVSGANVSGVDSGFSFNVVTNTRGGNAVDDAAGDRTVQGSLRQFIQNANAIQSTALNPNSMRFVPAVGTNESSGGNNLWQLTVDNALPQITDQYTIIDGRAYSAADGTTVLDTNTATLGYTGRVGLGADLIANTADDPTVTALNGPEFEIVEGGAAVVNQGLDIQASNVTVRRIAIHGFGNEDPDMAVLFAEADIRVGTAVGTDVGSAFTGIVIEDNVIGTGAASVADPGAPNQSVTGIAVFGPDGGTIQRNLIAYAGRFGIFLSNDADTWTISANDIRENAYSNTNQDGLDVGNLSGGAIITGNYFYNNWGGGYDSYRGAGGNTIENNTFLDNGRGASEPASLRLYGTGTTVRYNLVQNSGSGVNPGPGVLVVQDDGTAGTPSTGNRISRNSFQTNGCDRDRPERRDRQQQPGRRRGLPRRHVGAGNAGIASPVIAAAGLSGTNLTVSGTGPANATIEIYRAVGALNDQLAGITYGEGVQFLGTAVADGAGNWSNTFSVAGLLSVGQSVSAIAISGTSNTSEFGANFTVTSLGNSISGTIYNDVNADANVSALEGVFANRANSVRLYLDNGDGIAGAGDTLQTTVGTNASGQYSFTGLADGTYWVVVDSKALDADTNVWVEQTYGSAGAVLYNGAYSYLGVGRRHVRRHGGRRRQQLGQLRRRARPDGRRTRYPGHYLRGKRYEPRLGIQRERGHQRPRRRHARRRSSGEPAHGAGLAAAVHPERQRARRRECHGVRPGRQPERRRRRRPGWWQ